MAGARAALHARASHRDDMAAERLANLLDELAKDRQQQFILDLMGKKDSLTEG